MGKIDDTVKILLDIDKVLAGDDLGGFAGDFDSETVTEATDIKEVAVKSTKDTEVE